MGRVNILVIGDDEETCTYLEVIFSAKGWMTDQAWVNSKALELARKNAYDAVVFAYRRPGLDGTEMCRRIREAQPSTHEIFLTNTPSVDTVYTAVEAGAERVLAKPIEPAELIRIVEEQIVAPS
jgi:two-component system alkaline phosphatase synthesis response regulator PhoP